MSEWVEYSLEDVAEITSSKRIFYADYVDYGIPFYRSKEIIELYNRSEISNSLYISEQKYLEIKEKYGVPVIGDILLTSVGTLGIPYLVNNSNEFYFKDGNLTWIRKINKNIVLPDFIYCLLNSPLGKNKLDEITIGSTQAALTIAGLKKIKISVPNLSEQLEIVNVIQSISKKIELLHRQNKTLESMAETLFRQWFVEEAQDDWEEKTLADFGMVVCGKTPSKKKSEYYGSDIPFLKIPDMHGRVFISSTEDNLSLLGAESQLNKLLPEGSLCVSCIATVGLVCITSKPMQTNQQINSIIPKSSKYLYFLFLLMKSMNDELHSLASGGTTTLNLNTGNFSKIKICVPPKEDIFSFNQSVYDFFEKIKSNTNQIQTLENLRDTLLPKLMSGEVRVNYTPEEIKQ